MSDTKTDRPKYRVEVEEVKEIEETPEKHAPKKHVEKETPEVALDSEPAKKEVLLESEPEPKEAKPESTTEEMQEWLANMQNGEAEPRFVKPKQERGGAGKYLAILLVIIVLAALGGGVYYYNKNVSKDVAETQEPNKMITNEGTGTPAASPTPMPTAVAVDLSKYKVQILNGSGTSGEAGKAQSYLQTVGFKDFKTGNASAFNYANTEVALKKDVSEEAFTKAKSALEPYYQSVVKTDKVLDDKSPYDIVVTVGKKK